ncbi:MAG: hypothetical protein AAFX02_06355 [Pseudomonadota bacterium]
MRNLIISIAIVACGASVANAEKVRPTKPVTQKVTSQTSSGPADRSTLLWKSLAKQRAFRTEGSLLRLDRSRSSGNLASASEYLVVHAVRHGRQIERLVSPVVDSKAKNSGPIARLDSEIQGEYMTSFKASYSVPYLPNASSDFQRFKVVFSYDFSSNSYTVRYYHSPKNSRVGLWSNYTTLVYQDVEQPSARTTTNIEMCRYLTCNEKKVIEWHKTQSLPFTSIPDVYGEQQVFRRGELQRRLSSKWLSQDYFMSE